MLRFLTRLFRHRWLDVRHARRALNAQELAALSAQVQTSEAAHTGEICICLEAGLPLSYLLRRAPARERALALFGKLRVWDTADNNGVLIYLLLGDHAVEIIADRGLSTHLGDETWLALLHAMQPLLAQGQYAAALSQACSAVDAALRQHHPLPAEQSRGNTLPNRPVLL